MRTVICVVLLLALTLGYMPSNARLYAASPTTVSDFTDEELVEFMTSVRIPLENGTADLRKKLSDIAGQPIGTRRSGYFAMKQYYPNLTAAAEDWLNTTYAPSVRATQGSSLVVAAEGLDITKLKDWALAGWGLVNLPDEIIELQIKQDLHARYPDWSLEKLNTVANDVSQYKTKTYYEITSVFPGPQCCGPWNGDIWAAILNYIEGLLELDKRIKEGRSGKKGGGGGRGIPNVGGDDGNMFIGVPGGARGGGNTILNRDDGTIVIINEGDPTVVPPGVDGFQDDAYTDSNPGRQDRDRPE